MCERARTFQQSVEEHFLTDHPHGGHEQALRAQLQQLLKTYYEDLRKVSGASGKEVTRVLKHRRSIDPAPVQPAPAGGEGEPLQAGASSPLAAAATGGEAEHSGPISGEPAPATHSPTAARNGKGAARRTK